MSFTELDLIQEPEIDSYSEHCKELSRIIASTAQDRFVREQIAALAKAADADKKVLDFELTAFEVLYGCKTGTC